MKGFKQAAIACVKELLFTGGYHNREAYHAEKILGEDRVLWQRKIPLSLERCTLCSHLGVGVGDIAVATRQKRSSYAGRSYRFLHEDCLKKWAEKHPVQPAPVKEV